MNLEASNNSSIDESSDDNKSNTNISVESATKNHTCCPSCKSDIWKTAKMVVMENSTQISGQMSGSIADPGKFSGGARNFLLADRWFELNHELEANVDLQASSGLVQAVRQLMLDQSAQVQMPPIPWAIEEPKAPPDQPSIPEFPVEPIDIPWYRRFMRGMLISTGTSVILAIAIPIVGASLFIVSVPVLLALSRSANDVKRWKYEDAVKAHPDLVARTIEGHQLAVKQHKVNIEAYEHWQELMVQYEAQVQAVLVRRELLWENSRACMRCGTAYRS